MAIENLLTRAQEISSDAERVTQAHLRKVTLPGGAGVLGLITLDNGEDHTKPNTFGPRGLISLNAAIDAALADDEVTALGVTGKPFILAAGQGDPAQAGVGDALGVGGDLLRAGKQLVDAHQATSPVVAAPLQCGFSQITVPPMPMPTHMVVSP